MIHAGFAGFLAIASETTDHLWIILTDEAADPLAVLVMLTDVRNIETPNLVLAAGKRLTPQFTLNKPSTIHFARARKLDWSVLRHVVTSANFSPMGLIDSVDLGATRKALLDSPHTPVDVLEYCRGRAW